MLFLTSICTEKSLNYCYNTSRPTANTNFTTTSISNRPNSNNNNSNN